MRRWAAVLAAGAGLVWACQFDGTLRAYLSVSFWSPFLKTPAEFERAGVKRVDVAYAGMGPLSATPLGRLREAYRKISKPQAAAKRTARTMRIGSSR